MVEVKVVGLSLDDTSKAPILVLRNTATEELLPIWIGAMEAMAISVALNSVDVPRPLTHDLLLNTVSALGAHLVGVDIIDVREGTYYAELNLVVHGQHQRVDCRPSDGIALALRASVPILVSEHVLEQAASDRLRPSVPEEGFLVRRSGDNATDMARGDAADGARPQPRPLIRTGGRPSIKAVVTPSKQGGGPTIAPGTPPGSATGSEPEDKLAELLKSLDPETKYRM